MIKKAIEIIVNKGDLTYDEAYAAMREVTQGHTTPVQTAAFLAALSAKRTRRATVEEIAGCAGALRDQVVRVDAGMDMLEIAGTGGDGSSSFNISTTSAFVAAAAGIQVAKHGTRASSSQSGTADCLEALGANIDADADKCRELLQQVGFCFFYGEKYHQSLRCLDEISRELGARNVFSILSPLINPASPSYYLLGVYDDYLVESLAKVLIRLGVKRGLVVFGQDRIDEISMSAPTDVCEIREGFYKSYTIRPEDFGFRRCRKEELVGGMPRVNAGITRDILNGTEHGPKRQIVLLNAGAAIYAAGAADSISDGITKAAECIDSGEALRKMEAFIRLSKQ